jgi:cell division control protein 45
MRFIQSKFTSSFSLEEIMFGSFTIQRGYKNKLCASDVVFAVTALLENSTV